MKKFSLVLALLFSISALVLADEWKTFGKDLELTDTTKVSDILDTPEKYIGKKVLIEGRVVDVCKKRGCWVEIASDKEFQTILVKVKDGEIVFPMEAKGHLGLFEGVVEKLELSKEQCIRQMKHHAEETGEEFDPATVTEGKTIYRLRGLGAKINYTK
jgi:hypothetical protein